MNFIDAQSKALAILQTIPRKFNTIYGENLFILSNRNDLITSFRKKAVTMLPLHPFR